MLGYMPCLLTRCSITVPSYDLAFLLQPPRFYIHILKSSLELLYITTGRRGSKGKGGEAEEEEEEEEEGEQDAAGALQPATT